MADPLTVPCPDCLAPTGTACAGRYGTHAQRARAATLQAAERGTCALCGHLLLRGVRPDHGPDVQVWHPIPDHAATCPPMPDPRTDWTGYATARQQGLDHGLPGAEHFRPTEPYPCGHATLTLGCGGCDPGAIDLVLDEHHRPLPMCPDCRAGKHPICTGEAWDPDLDLPVRCACPCPG
ncbi:hypothetical protein Pam4_69 [Pseudanabaena phage Pam4]|nr:hypothetical protein Pam4_69 [Pseudanabaena phage Pam4]